jgi:hypothetical protein
MTAIDLSIGNFIDRNGLMEVKTINQTTIRVYDHVNKCSISHGFPLYEFDGIPIDSEWLVKFGFLMHDGENYGRGDFKLIHFPEDFGYGFYHSDNFDLLLCDIKYVHQLQNLYYALTKQELTIQP